MSENFEKMFYEEVREKRTTASGVHGLKGKRGLVGKMVTPADLSPKSYKAAKDLGSFNIADFLSKLAEAPGLKSVLLERMDDEYRNYRMATERTLSAVVEVLQMTLEPLQTLVVEMDQRLARLEGGRAGQAPEPGAAPRRPRADARGAGDTEKTRVAGAGREATPAPANASRRKSGKPRIRWGSTEDEIRQSVRLHARELLQEGHALTVSTIQKQVPSMLRYLYGEKAVFAGLKGLVQDLAAQEQAANQ